MSETCGKFAAPFIPRRGEYFSCVLPAGHKDDCRPGGTCEKHGTYSSEPGTPPQCPKCEGGKRTDDCIQTVVPRDAQQIPSVIAALAEGLRARDAQLNALSEQVRMGFEAHGGFREVQVKLIAIQSRQINLAEQVRLLDERMRGVEGYLADLKYATIATQTNAQVSKPARKPKKGKKREPSWRRR